MREKVYSFVEANLWLTSHTSLFTLLISILVTFSDCPLNNIGFKVNYCYVFVPIIWFLLSKWGPLLVPSQHPLFLIKIFIIRKSGRNSHIEISLYLRIEDEVQLGFSWCLLFLIFMLSFFIHWNLLLWFLSYKFYFFNLHLIVGYNDPIVRYYVWIELLSSTGLCPGDKSTGIAGRHSKSFGS